MQRIRKGLNESNGDYEGTAAKNSHSDEKRTSEFVGEIQARMNNDPSKLIRSIARDMGVCDFFIWQVVHEDIWYFSYKTRKG